MKFTFFRQTKRQGPKNTYKKPRTFVPTMERLETRFMPAAGIRDGLALALDAPLPVDDLSSDGLDLFAVDPHQKHDQGGGGGGLPSVSDGAAGGHADATEPAAAPHTGAPDGFPLNRVPGPMENPPPGAAPSDSSLKLSATTATVSHASTPPTSKQPNAVGKTTGQIGSDAKTVPPTPTLPHKGGGLGEGVAPLAKAGPLVSGGTCQLGVMDMNNGLTLSPSAPVTDFSTYGVILDADVSSTSSSAISYSWDLTNAPDASSATGTSSYELKFTWATFSTGTRTDSVKISITQSSTVQVTETITFKVEGTSSPAFSTQFITTLTWANLIPPDAVNSRQVLGGTGPYYQVGLTDGGLHTSQTLPAYNPNVPALTLQYVSTAANAEPIFVVHYLLPSGVTVPASIAATLTFNGTAGTTYNVSTQGTTDTPDYLFAGDTMEIAIGANATSLSTGRYSYSFQLVDSNANPQTTTYSGYADVLNYKSSVFGAGWNPAGVQRIFSVSGGVILDVGDGTSLWFRSGITGGTFVTPPGDFSTLTQSGGVYTRTMPDGTQINFNSSGYQTSVVDRNSNTTSYAYNGFNQLTSITDLNNQSVTFSYSGSNVTSILDPANRRTTLAYSSGQLTSIKLPDGSLYSYAYDSNNDLTTLTDPLSHKTTITYTQTRVTQAKRADNTPEGFTPEQLQGLQNGSSGGFNPTLGTTEELVPQSPGIETDPKNHPSNNYIDWLGFGAPTAAVDATNDAVLKHVNQNGLGWMTADALGNPTRNFFDGSGNVTTSVQPDNSKWQYTYNSDSEVSVTTDPLGNVSTATFDSHGNETTFKDPLGNLTSCSYTSQGFTSTMTDPLNHTTTYSYNSTGELTTSTDALGNVTTSLYDSFGNLTTSIDARGDRTTYSFDSLGRQTQVQDALGNLTTTLYDSAGNATTSIDARGDRTTYSFDGLNRQTQVQDALGNLTTTLYDSAGNATTSIDARGDRTTYSFDSDNRQTQVQDALGNLTTTLYDSQGNVTSTIDARGDRTTYSFDSFNRQTQVQDALGNLTTSLYDSNGNLTTKIDARGDRTTYSFDAQNRQTQVQDGLGNLTTTLYDQAGNATTTIDALNHRTTYSFDNDNRQTQVQDALGNLTTTIYDQAGNVTTTIDALNHRTTYSFDNDNRQTQGQDTLGNLTTTVYDAAGNVTTRIDARGNRTTYSFDGDNRQTQVQDALGNLTTTVYDAAGNVSATIDARGDRTTYSFDGDNRQTQVQDAIGNLSTTVYDPAGNVSTSIDARGGRTTYSFDPDNRQTTMKNPDGNVTTTVYDAAGNVTNTIDPNGNKTTFSYDALNRKTATTDPLGAVSTMLFDAAGNQTNVIDPDGNKTTFAYDADNRLTKQTDPLGANTTFAYDAASRQTSKTDRDGRVTNSSYDNDNRLTARSWVVGGSTTNLMTFTYDGNGNELTAANYNGTYTMAYDALNRVTSTQEPFGLTVTATYDQAANRTLLQDSFGGVLTSLYDTDNRLTSRQFGGTSQTPLRFDLAYYANSQVSQVSRYSNLSGTTLIGTTSYVYDSASQLTNQQDKNGSGTVLNNYTYTYDSAGNVKTQVLGGTTTTYTYNAANELTNDTANSYSYDLAGNRNMTGYQTGTGNELKNDGTWTYTYDSEGNMTEKSQGANATTLFYTFDNNNQMTTAQQYSKASGGTLQASVTYVYDALQNRLEVDSWTQSGGTTTVTRFGYDGNQVWVDLNSSNGLQTRYLHGDLIDQLFARINSGGTAAWYLTDRLESIRGMVDNTGALQETVAYDGYGNITSDSNSSFGDRYKFTGRELDSVTGLQYNRARYYSGPVGKWVSQDPLGFKAGDGNLYRYVDNSPPNIIDPTGLQGPKGKPTYIITVGSSVLARYGPRGGKRTVATWIYFDMNGAFQGCGAVPLKSEDVREDERMYQRAIINGSPLVFGAAPAKADQGYFIFKYDPSNPPTQGAVTVIAPIPNMELLFESEPGKGEGWKFIEVVPVKKRGMKPKDNQQIVICM